jgi:hypothetical protein
LPDISVCAHSASSRRSCRLHRRDDRHSSAGTSLSHAADETGTGGAQRVRICLIANLEVATGQLIKPPVGDTRTKEDFVRHVEQLPAQGPESEWMLGTGQLDTHRSEGIVRLVA